MLLPIVYQGQILALVQKHSQRHSGNESVGTDMPVHVWWARGGRLALQVDYVNR
jgi:hypothetical protein